MLTRKIKDDEGKEYSVMKILSGEVRSGRPGGPLPVTKNAKLIFTSLPDKRERWFIWVPLDCSLNDLSDEELHAKLKEAKRKNAKRRG